MSEFPAHQSAIRQLVSFLESEASNSVRPKVYSYDRISTISRLAPDRKLALLLHRIVESGLLEQFIRVEYNHAGIGDFKTLDDVPEEILDPNTGKLLTIMPEYLRLYYRLYPRVAHAS